MLFLPLHPSSQQPIGCIFELQLHSSVCPIPVSPALFPFPEMKATWNGHVIAESDTTEEVEGNHYFPPGALRRDFFEESDAHTTCPWKGEAHYYHLTAEGERSEDAAWYYPAPKDAARHIKDHVAFYGSKVDITE